MKKIAYTLVFGSLLFVGCSSNTETVITPETESTQNIAKTADEKVLTIEELRIKVTESGSKIDQLEDEIEALLKEI